MDIKEICSHIDHTLLAPTSTWPEVRVICEEALESNAKNLLNKLNLGKLSYGSIALKNLIHGPFVPCRIELDDGKYTFTMQRMIFAAFMNLAFEGGGFCFAPDAELSDGMLNFIAAGDISFPQMLRTFPKAFAGKHYGCKGVEHAPFAKIRVQTAEPLWVHTDGEVSMKSDDITVECLPSCLQLII